MKKVGVFSHGNSASGGFEHQVFWAKQLSFSLGDEGEFDLYHQQKKFKGVVQWLKLWFLAGNCKNDFLLITERVWIPAYIASLFRRKQKIVFILHSFDFAVIKSPIRKINFLLFKYISTKKKILLVTGSQSWVNQFSKVFNKEIGLLPNLFNNFYYEDFRTSQKCNWIYLGQFSKKTDLIAYKNFISKNKQHHFRFYFNTLDKSERGFWEGIPIIYTSNKTQYLNWMAHSKLTISFTKFAEGWNRINHESFLVGTQVLVDGKLGSAELAVKANGYFLNDRIDFENIKTINREILAEFDESLAVFYCKNLLNHLF